MEFFCICKDILFMWYVLVFNVILLVMFFVVVFFLFYCGLYLFVEFIGGMVIEVQYQQVVEFEFVCVMFGKFGYVDVQVQNFGMLCNVLICLQLKEGFMFVQQSDQVMGVLKVQSLDVMLQCVEFVGLQVGCEFVIDGLFVFVCVVIGIVIYLLFCFEWKYVVVGIIVNLYDVVIIFGFFVFFQWEFLLVVFVVIFVVFGYLVNELVVIFDWICEMFCCECKMSVQEVINYVIMIMMLCMIIMYMLMEMMVLLMFFFGGLMLYYFVFVLMVGIMFGIYLLVFVVGLFVMWFGIKCEDLIKEKKIVYDLDDLNVGVQV